MSDNEDCLSIRDIGKALSVIRDLNIPEDLVRDLYMSFHESRRRAEYQRTLDNMKKIIEEKCGNKECKNGLTAKIIKILLYTGDTVMQKRLSITEKKIATAGERLKVCVTCLDIDRKEVFL